MNGVDISHWQKGIDLSRINCDFVIAKATEGVNFVDGCFEKFMDKALDLNKCIGFYHFARPENNSAMAEAQFFYNHTVKYYGKGIPILDWESSGKSNVAWAKEWLDAIQSMTGIKPMIYMSESVVNQFDWSKVAKADYGLWVAKYRDNQIDLNYDMTNAGKKPQVRWWKFYAMWQWTSSGKIDGYDGRLDCDLFYGDKSTWLKYAGVHDMHVVKEGETLTYIADKYGITVDELVLKNLLIKTGQVLRV